MNVSPRLAGLIGDAVTPPVEFGEQAQWQVVVAEKPANTTSVLQ